MSDWTRAGIWNLQQYKPVPQSDVSKHVWCALYLRDSENRVLLRQRNSTDVIDAGLWGPPGGKVEPGEMIEAAAYRELLEETGLDAQSLERVSIFDEPNGVVFLYRVPRWSGDLTTEPGYSPWLWVPMESLPSPLQGGLADWLNQSQQKGYRL